MIIISIASPVAYCWCLWSKEKKGSLGRRADHNLSTALVDGCILARTVHVALQDHGPSCEQGSSGAPKHSCRRWRPYPRRPNPSLLVARSGDTCVVSLSISFFLVLFVPIFATNKGRFELTWTFPDIFLSVKARTAENAVFALIEDWSTALEPLFQFTDCRSWHGRFSLSVLADGSMHDSNATALAVVAET